MNLRLPTPHDLIMMCEKQERFLVDHKFITLEQMNTSEPLPDNRDNVLLLRFLYAKKSKSPDGRFKNYNRNEGSSESQYERLIVLRDVHAPVGRNLLIVPLMKRDNGGTFFSKVLGIRDNGSISPGTMLAVESPDPTDDWSNDMAVFRSPKPAIAVQIDQDSIYLPDVPADEESEVMHGFMYNGMTAKLFDVYFVYTNCCGDFCDALFATTGDHCACFTPNKREASIVAIFSMTFERNATPGYPPVKIQVKNFTSKKFTKFFLKGQKMPSNVLVHNLNLRVHKRKFMKSVDDIFAYVNNYGGFDVEGWVKRGMIVDQGVDQPLGNRSQERKLNSVLAYHATSILPSVALKNLPDLHALRFDPTESTPATPPRTLPNFPPPRRLNTQATAGPNHATVLNITNGHPSGGSGGSTAVRTSQAAAAVGATIQTQAPAAITQANLGNSTNGGGPARSGGSTAVGTRQAAAAVGATIQTQAHAATTQSNLGNSTDRRGNGGSGGSTAAGTRQAGPPVGTTIQTQAPAGTNQANLGISTNGRGRGGSRGSTAVGTRQAAAAVGATTQSQAPAPTIQANVPNLTNGCRTGGSGGATTQANGANLTNGRRPGGSAGRSMAVGTRKAAAAVGDREDQRPASGEGVSTTSATTQVVTPTVLNRGNESETALVATPTAVATTHNQATVGALTNEGQTGRVISPPRPAKTRDSLPGIVLTGPVRALPAQTRPPRQKTEGTLPGEILKSPIPMSPPQGDTVTDDHQRGSITHNAHIEATTATTANPKAGTMRNKQDAKKKPKRNSNTTNDENPKKLTTEQNKRRAAGKIHPNK